MYMVVQNKGEKKFRLRRPYHFMARGHAEDAEAIDIT